MSFKIADMQRLFFALVLICSLADTVFALAEDESRRTPGSASKEPKVGVAAGGCSITGFAKPGWQEALCKSIEQRIKGQTLFKEATKKLQGKHVSCLMTVRSNGEISHLRIGSESRSVSDDAILSLVRAAEPFEPIAPVWSASCRYSFQRAKCGLVDKRVWLYRLYDKPCDTLLV